MAAVEAQFPFVLTGVVGRIGTADAIVDVVVDHSVVDQRALPAVDIVVERRVVLAVADIVGVGDEVVDGERVHLRLIEVDGLGLPRDVSALPGGGTIVGEVGEVARRVVAVGNRHGGRDVVGGDDTVAGEAPVHLQGPRDGDREDRVAGHLITSKAVIDHGDRSPLGVVSKVCHPDVAARLDLLIFEIHAGNSIRIGDLGGDQDNLPRRRLLRRVGDLPYLRCRARSEARIFRARGRECRLSHTACGSDQLEVQTEIAAADTGVEKLNADCVDSLDQGAAIFERFYHRDALGIVAGRLIADGGFIAGLPRHVLAMDLDPVDPQDETVVEKEAQLQRWWDLAGGDGEFVAQEQRTVRASHPADWGLKKHVPDIPESNRKGRGIPAIVLDKMGLAPVTYRRRGLAGPGPPPPACSRGRQDEALGEKVRRYRAAP